MNKKVFHIVSSKRYTGGAQVAYLWHKALLSEGVESFFIYKGGYKLEEKIKNEKNTISYYNLADKIKKILKIPKDSFLLAHLSEDHWLSFFLRNRRNTIFVFHKTSALKKDFFHKFIYLNRKVIFAFDFKKSVYFKKFKIFPPIYDLNIFYRGNQPGEILNICTIGKLEKERQHCKFISLLSEMKKLHFPFKGFVIGQGNYLEELKKMSSELGLENDIEFLGYFEDEKLAENLRKMDFLVWVSPGSQGSHRAIIEGALCGAIPCSFEMDGIGWWIEDKKSGLILFDDFKRSAEKIIDVFKNKEEYLKIRNLSYNEISKKIDKKKFVEEFLNFIYENISSSA